MFAGLTLRGAVRSHRAHAAPAKPVDGLPSLVDVERLAEPLAEPYLDGGRIELQSLARAHDRSYVVLDYVVRAPGPRASLESARAAIAAGTDPSALAAAPGAELRVTVATATASVRVRR